MDLAEPRQRLGTQRQRSRTAGVIPGRGAALYRRVHRGNHRSLERGSDMGPGVELFQPVPRSCAGSWASAAADASSDVRLAFRHAAFELRADLEQHEIV